MDAIEAEISGCEDKGFHGLIDRSRTDRLHFCAMMFAHDTCNGASSRSRP